MALTENDKAALFVVNFASPRLFASPFAGTVRETQSELYDCEHGAAGACHVMVRLQSVTTSYRRPSVSDPLEVQILLKEAGLYRHVDSERAESWWCRCSRPNVPKTQSKRPR